MDSEAKLQSEINRITELINENESKDITSNRGDNTFTDNQNGYNTSEFSKDDITMINNLQNIVHEIDTNANADSVTSRRKDISDQSRRSKHINTGRSKPVGVSNPSLASRMNMRLGKYTKTTKNYKTLDNFTTRSSQKSGNNPLFSYPSIPPPIVFDPKYSRNNSENFTRFVTKTVSNGQELNPLETVERLYKHQKRHNEKLDAQRYLKYQDDCRENRNVPLLCRPMRSSKSEHSLPLYRRYDMLSKQRDHNLKAKQLARVAELESDFQREMEYHEKLAVHNKNRRKQFSVQEWDIFYNDRFQKYINKRGDRMDEKRDRHYAEILKMPQADTRSSRGLKVEDRLLQEGEKYQDKINMIRQIREKSRQTQCVSAHSRKILNKRNKDEITKLKGNKNGELESAFAVWVDLKQTGFTPSHGEGTGVISDFINIPSTTPKQFKPKSMDKSISEGILEFKDELYEVVTPDNYEADDTSYNRRSSKSRNKEKIEQLLRRTGKTAMTASDSKYLHTIRSSNSGINSYCNNKFNKELFSDEHLDDDNSENENLCETDTIEKVINGDYQDDQNVNYYSVGKDNSIKAGDRHKEGMDISDISGPLMDPFYHKSDEDMLYNDEEFQTARLNVEIDNSTSKIINVKDYEGNYGEASPDNSSAPDVAEDSSFDNSDQMKRFLNSIKGDRRKKRKLEKDTPEADNSDIEKEQRTITKVNSLEIFETPENVDFEKPSNEIGPETLEMIQEETEQDDTRIKESVLVTPDRARYTSEPINEEEGFNDIHEYDTNPKNEEINTNYEKRKEELMEKVMHSAYSSMSSFKTNLMESLDLNKSELQELEAMGIDALSIIKRIMKEFPHIFKSSRKITKSKTK